MEFEVKSSLHTQSNANATIKLVNKGSYAEVHILKSDYPSLIGKSAIADLINRHIYTHQYAPSCISADIKSFANNELSEKIKETEKALAEMKMIRKIAKRNEIKFIDMTGGEK